MGKIYWIILHTNFIMDGKGKGKEEQELKQLHYRLTITSKDCKAIENITAEIVRRAKMRKEDNPQMKVTGPRRMPRTTLRVTTRRSPCGNGTNTFDKYEMRIFKRVLDFECTREDLQKITQINIEAGIIIEANEID